MLENGYFRTESRRQCLSFTRGPKKGFCSYSCLLRVARGPLQVLSSPSSSAGLVLGLVISVNEIIAVITDSIQTISTSVVKTNVLSAGYHGFAFTLIPA